MKSRKRLLAALFLASVCAACGLTEPDLKTEAPVGSGKCDCLYNVGGFDRVDNGSKSSCRAVGGQCVIK